MRMEMEFLQITNLISEIEFFCTEFRISGIHYKVYEMSIDLVIRLQSQIQMAKSGVLILRITTFYALKNVMIQNKRKSSYCRAIAKQHLIVKSTG